jgi:Icc protein
MMQSIRLLHLTDPHLFGDETRTLYGVRTAESLQLVLDAALRGGPPPSAVIVTGDIGDDLSAAAYANFRRALSRCGAPVYCVPGNHDDPKLMASLLDDDGFQFGDCARLGEWGLVMLDTSLPGEAGGRLSEAELERFEAQLGALGKVPVVVGMHHPPIPVGSAWLDEVGLQDRHRFLDVVDRHPQVCVVLCGHVHQELDTLRGNVRLLATPSTCAQFTPRTPRCVMDPRPPGYRWLSLGDDGTIVTGVGWVPHTATRAVEEELGRS